MGIIQSGINQSLVALAALSSQSPLMQENRGIMKKQISGTFHEKRGEKVLSTEQKKLQKNSFGKAPEPSGASVDLATKMKIAGLNEQFEAAKTLGQLDKMEEIQNKIKQAESTKEERGSHEEEPRTPSPEEEEYLRQEAMQEMPSIEDEKAIVATQHVTEKVNKVRRQHTFMRQAEKALINDKHRKEQKKGGKK